MVVNTLPDTQTIVLDLRPVVDMTDEQFFKLCQANRDLRLERTATGEIVIMPPTGGETGHRNLVLGAALYAWARKDGSGIAFDSSTGFVLPNSAIRSPDAAWVRRDRWAQLTPEQKQRFLPLCPDFVMELRSPTDRLHDLQGKLAEYIANGARLGWLVDPLDRSVYIYRPRLEGHRPVTHLHAPDTLTGDPILPGFVLDLAEIWEPL